jgi:hypothetical protein
MSDMSNNSILRVSKYVNKAFKFRKNVCVNS